MFLPLCPPPTYQSHKLPRTLLGNIFSIQQLFSHHRRARHLVTTLHTHSNHHIKLVTNDVMDITPSVNNKRPSPEGEDNTRPARTAKPTEAMPLDDRVPVVDLSIDRDVDALLAQIKAKVALHNHQLDRANRRIENITEALHLEEETSTGEHWDRFSLMSFVGHGT